MHGRRPFAELLPALEALDGWRGAARCVFAPPWHCTAFALTWHRRWDTSFNMTALRFISFALDLHWARQGPARDATSRAAAAGKAERALAEAPLPGADHATQPCRIAKR